jgi:hypothetical protein
LYKNYIKNYFSYLKYTLVRNTSRSSGSDNKYSISSTSQTRAASLKRIRNKYQLWMRTRNNLLNQHYQLDFSCNYSQTQTLVCTLNIINKRLTLFFTVLSLLLFSYIIAALGVLICFASSNLHFFSSFLRIIQWIGPFIWTIFNNLRAKPTKIRAQRWVWRNLK